MSADQCLKEDMQPGNTGPTADKLMPTAVVIAVNAVIGAAQNVA